ncbi:hyaluronan synthase [Enterococcus sp. AZ194]|uniref:glycosyltransferase n=1 Tax=Enterococcus sp. AZ194 TaxID=2774629 RepID=UPI003F210C27
MRKIYKTNVLMNVVLIVALIVAIFWLKSYRNDAYKWFEVLLSVNFGYLLFKVVTSFFYKPVDSKIAEQGITAIIPCYNETLESVEKAIDSLMKQTVLVDEIIFVDDGSQNTECFDYLSTYNHAKVEIVVHRFEENQGKKAAILWAITHAKNELLLMLDSDGELQENAIEELRKPFADEKVGTVCGKIMIRNYNAGFLARVQEIIYFNAFEVGRASQSLFKSVVVASGALSMHRKKIFDEEALDTFKKERFFGIKCVAGDDRLLTDISKQKGYDSVYQNTAICYTEVPEKLPKYFKQQVRWLKSAYLQSLYSIRHCWKKPMLLLYQMLEAYLWAVNLVISIYIGFTTGIPVSIEIILFWVIYSVLVSLVNAIRFRQYGWHLYLVSTLYSFIYGFFILVARIYALLTLWRTGWSTR